MNHTRLAPHATLAGATYQKSSRSTATGNCVEVANLDGGHRAIRDSKNPTGPTLTIAAAEWTAFTTRLHTGEFD
jgi:hypothetical protein